jgi:hypothetical protein
MKLMQNELWKPIPIYPGYEASSAGRIKKLSFITSDGKRRKEKIISPCYVQPAVGKGRNVVNMPRGPEAVARMVLMAHDRLPALKEVGRHLDDDTRNDTLKNLAWGSAQDNADDAVRNGCIKRGSEVNTSRLIKRQVLYIRKHGKLMPRGIRAGSNTAALAAKFGVSGVTIVIILKRQSWTHI